MEQGQQQTYFKITLHYFILFHTSQLKNFKNLNKIFWEYKRRTEKEVSLQTRQKGDKIVITIREYKYRPA